jgi:hypothetical protein
MKILLAIRTESEANLRESWHVKAKRVRLQRSIARTMFSQKFRPATVGASYTVTLTRIAPRPLDTDNLARSFKAVRDGIADALGIDDGSKRLTWNYAQEKGPPKKYAVRIEIQ